MRFWLILTTILPPSPSGLRMRIWRALKASHCGTLREGVYMLPATALSAQHFRAMVAAIRDPEAPPHLLELQSRDEARESGLRALFNRSALYVDFARALKVAGQALQAATETQVRKSLRALDHQLQGLLAADFFPGVALLAAKAGLLTLRRETGRQLSTGEPATGSGAIARLAIADYQGRIWATRTQPWVDRLTSAWLVERSVDQSPSLVWLQNTSACPPAVPGYDFDGAVFSHVGDRVTYEVLAESFGLDAHPALRRLGTLVHALDVGGIGGIGGIGGMAVDEGPGAEMLVRGQQAQPADDDALLQASGAWFNTRYAGLLQP